MQHYQVTASQLHGQIAASPSKSHTLRAILFASMATGDSVISHILPSPDATAMINACRMLGANISVDQDTLSITGVAGQPHCPDNVIDAGNSGQVLRFIAAIAALLPDYVVLTGDHSVRHNRPLQPLITGLKQLGVFCESTKGDGYAPVIVRGPLRSGTTQLDGADSQPVSGLLMASAFAKGTTHIYVDNPGEKPWVGLTLYWFDKLGIDYENIDYCHYVISGPNTIEGFNYHVAGDFSSMAFPIAAALVTGSEISLSAVDIEDPQGDKQLISVLQAMGAQIDIDTKTQILTVKSGSQLHGIDVDINDFVDAVTILAVVACYASGTTRIRGAGITRYKECNRLQAITCELKKMGAHIQETEDGLEIEGHILQGATLQTYHDHRMVMSLTVAALGAIGDSIIEDVVSVAKSYPDFVKDMHQLGAQIKEI